jgi:hypothetical protein
MKNKVIVTALLLLCMACRNSKKTLLVREKSVNGFDLQLQYLPSEDKEVLRFRLNVRNADGATMKHTDDVRFNYGLDSLFAFVNMADTIHPVDVIRVANGNLNGVEFMLLFSRPDNYSGADGQVIFKDWLFTSQLMAFPVEGLDALNQQI